MKANWPEEFDYRERGPDVWERLCSRCAGKYQSPIALCTNTAVRRSEPGLIWGNWQNVPQTLTLCNDGHTVTLTATWASPDDVPYIAFSHREDQYVFSRVHFHWGANDKEGSEHTLDDQRIFIPEQYGFNIITHYTLDSLAVAFRRRQEVPSFPLEMQVDAIRKDLSNLEEAVFSPTTNPICVITYFFKLGQLKNNPLEQLVISQLRLVEKVGQKVELKPQSLQWLIPDFFKDYLMYSGSLTTPPCSQVALYVISKVPQTVNSDQMRCFRTLMDNTGQRMTKNYRNLQKLNGRVVLQVQDD